MRFRQTQVKCHLLWHNNSTHFTCWLFTKVAAFGFVLNNFTKKSKLFSSMYDLEKDSILFLWLRSRLSASTAFASITCISVCIDLLEFEVLISSDFFLNIFSFRNAIVSLLSWCSSWCSGRIVRHISWFCNFSTISICLQKWCLPHFRRYFHSSHEFVHQMNENHWVLLHYQRFKENEEQNTTLDGTVTLKE